LVDNKENEKHSSKHGKRNLIFGITWFLDTKRLKIFH